MDNPSQSWFVQEMGGETRPHEDVEETFIGEPDRAHRDTGLRPHKRLSQRRQPLQELWTRNETSLHQGNQSQVERGILGNNAGYAVRLPFPAAVLEDDLAAVEITKPMGIERSLLGLPPTPPTTTDSNNVVLSAVSRPSDPLFADAVRNALDHRSSNHRLSTPAAHMPPHTPEPSPPSNLTEKRVSHLRPDALSTYPSSRADSYHTARETQSANRLGDLQSESLVTSSIVPVHIEQETQVQHDSDSSELDGPIETQIGRQVRIEDIISDILQTQHLDEQISEGSSSPGPRRYQFGDSSSTECSESLSSSPKRSNHSSEGLDERVREHTRALPESTAVTYEHQHGHGKPKPDLYQTPEFPDLIIPLDYTEKDISAEDVNNLVYQHIQQANVRKHGPTESLAMPVGIVAFREDKQHTLKRTTKCLTLRGTGSDGSPRSSIGSSLPQRRYTSLSMRASPVMKKDRLLPASGAPRHVSSPLPATAMQAFVPGPERMKPFMHMNERQHTLRRSRKIDRFEGPSSSSPVLSFRSSVTPPKPSLPSSPTTSTGHTLRRFSREQKLENLSHVRSMSEDPHSPRRKDFDMRLLHATPTPMSQFSDRTVEVLEARGVTIFPHHNESLVMLHDGSRPSSKDAMNPGQADVPGESTNDEELLSRTPPVLQPVSPLMHPRPAPEPPIVAVIPPTPNDELESMADAGDIHRMAEHKPDTQPGLLQRARRYSEGVIQPFLGRSFSLRRQPPTRPSTATDERPTNLSPFWRPRYFWEDVDSDDEYDEYGDLDVYYEEPSQHTLPRGGDTSDVVETRRVFPRNMSVRIPGFRGNGGFLVGNSLGLDRHGSNNRRHHIARRRASEEMLQQVSKDWVFTLPFSGKRRLRNVSLARWRRRLIDRHLHKQEREHERRCRILKEQIQH